MTRSAKYSFLPCALVLVASGCGDDNKSTPAQNGAGTNAGSIYWVDSAGLQIHKLDLGTGTDRVLGAASKVFRAPDGKLIIVGTKGIEETDEQILTTRVIKEDKTGFSMDDAEVNINDIAVSPDGTKIAYDNLSGKAYVCTRTDGAVLARFETTGATESVGRPNWTPDGRLVAVGGFGNQGIFVSDAALTTLTRIDPNLEQPRYAAASPDGTKIAFVVQKKVFVINLDGTGLTAIDTKDDADDRWPTWSPDGTVIAYFDGGRMKLRPSTGGDSVDVFDSYPALKDKLLVFGASAPMQWVP
jgi:Tol biopolymer transport system component